MGRRRNNINAATESEPPRLRRGKSPFHPPLTKGDRRGFASAWRSPLTLALVFALTLATDTASAQSSPSKEYQLKAVFLLRLAQFTQWPGEAFDNPETPITLCVLGANPFGDTLEAALRGETAHGRRLTTRQIRLPEQAGSCHVLFIGGTGPRTAKEIAAALAGRSVLTVRDAAGLPSSYDTIVNFLIEQNKIRLRINLAIAAGARLVLDPRLLRAAEVVNE